jgi:GT2 family glycosyltransferase
MPIESQTNGPRLVAGTRPGPDAYDVDIIILSLNRQVETLEAIHSALSQRGVRFHVTVLDQGSDTEVIRALARGWSTTQHFALYTVTTNCGVGGGRNVATSLGHGRIIIALDNDAIFQNRWVAAGALRAFQQKPDLGALGFNILDADGVSPDRFSWGYPARLISRFKDRFDTTTFVGAGHAIRRVTWNAVGGYDATLFFTWEEYDFCLAAIALKWRVCYDGGLAVIHKISPVARVGWDTARTKLFVRNRLIIARKWSSTRLYLLPLICGYLLHGTLNRRLAPTIDGIRAALSAEVERGRRMPKTMRHYIYANERRHRGSWFDRIRFEVFTNIHSDR